MKEMALGIVIALLPFILVLMWSILTVQSNIKSDYSTEFKAAKTDEIETAISNAVSDLRKRDFVPIGFNVTWDPLKKHYSIKAKGIAKDKLINYEP